MSTTANAGRAVAGCQPASGTPVSIAADAIESIADSYLRGLKAELDDAGYVPSEVVVAAEFDADCSITTQAEADRIRDVLYAADFLGAGTVRLEVGGGADTGKVQPAISALRERAERQGLSLALDDRN